MKIEHVLFPSVFSKLRIRLMEGHFNVFTRSVFRKKQKSDPVNGSLRKGVLTHETDKFMENNENTTKILLDVK